MQINQSDAVAALTEQFNRYEAALVGNDVATLDALFWDSVHTVRYGAGEHLYGMAAIRAFRASRPPKGLARRVTRTQLTVFGTVAATTHIEYERDGVPGTGRQTQTWIYFPELGWRVVSAHVSQMAG